MHSGHPRGKGERPGVASGVLERGQRLLQGNDRRVVVAGVAVALLLAAQDAVRRLDVGVGEGGRGVDRGRDRGEAPVLIPATPALAGVDGAGLETSRVLHDDYTNAIQHACFAGLSARGKAEKLTSEALKAEAC